MPLYLLTSKGLWEMLLYNQKLYLCAWMVGHVNLFQGNAVPRACWSSVRSSSVVVPCLWNQAHWSYPSCILSILYNGNWTLCELGKIGIRKSVLKQNKWTIFNPFTDGFLLLKKKAKQNKNTKERNKWPYTTNLKWETVLWCTDI